MKYQFFCSPVFSRTVFAAAVAVACSNASALTTLPEFTWNPAGAGLAGTSFTADNIIVSDFATVTFTAGSTFHEEGYLGVSSFQFGGKDIAAGGLNSTYSLYFHFTGDGVVNGPFTALNYQLFGTNSVPTFGPGGAISGAVAPVQLASGSLISGGTGTINGLPGAGATVTFNAASSPFYVTPPSASFYNMALTSFINAEGTVTPDRQRLHDRQRRRLAALRAADPGARDVCPDDGRDLGPWASWLGGESQVDAFSMIPGSPSLTLPLGWQNEEDS